MRTTFPQSTAIAYIGRCAICKRGYRLPDTSVVECCEQTVPLSALHGIFNAQKPCDGRCMGAAGPSCECSCEGANHGRMWASLSDGEIASFAERGARNRARAQARAEAQRSERIAAKVAKRQAWDDANPGLRDALNEYAGSRVSDLSRYAAILDEYGTLSEKMTEAAKAAIARQAAQINEPVPSGLREVTGVIKAGKVTRGRYGATIKMLIDCGPYRLWGTLPRALENCEIGDRVTFKATLTPSEDLGFGFFSRPTKARKLDSESE